MELDQIKYLDDGMKNRYAKLERLFDSDGWKLVMLLCAEWSEQSKERAASAQTWEDNRFAAGQRMAYFHLTKLEEATEREFIQLAEEAKAKTETADAEEFE